MLQNGYWLLIESFTWHWSIFKSDMIYIHLQTQGNGSKISTATGVWKEGKLMLKKKQRSESANPQPRNIHAAHFTFTILLVLEEFNHWCPPIGFFGYNCLHANSTKHLGGQIIKVHFLCEVFSDFNIATNQRKSVAKAWRLGDSMVMARGCPAPSYG